MRGIWGDVSWVWGPMGAKECHCAHTSLIKVNIYSPATTALRRDSWVCQEP